MGRPVFPHELGDPDFSWLVSSFQENNPQFCIVEAGSLPMVFIGEAREIEVNMGAEEAEQVEQAK